MKLCTRCKVEKEVSAFRLLVSGRPDSWCYACHLEHIRQKRAAARSAGQRPAYKPDPLNVIFNRWLQARA